MGEKTRFDCVYFSGSITLLPDPLQALKLVAAEFVNQRSGKSAGSGTSNSEKIYITQTFQLSKSPITEIVKPLLKILIRIDFGVVTYENELQKILDEFCKWSREKGDIWRVEKNEVIPGPGNTPWQKPRLVVLARERF